MSASPQELVGRLARAEDFDQAAELLAATPVPLDPNLAESLLRTAGQAAREGDPEAPVWRRVCERVQEYRYRFPRDEFFAPPEARRFVALAADAASGEEMMRLVQPFLAKLSANEVSALRSYRDLDDSPDDETAQRLSALAVYLRRELGLVGPHHPPSHYLDVLGFLHGAFQKREMVGALERCESEIDAPFASTLVGVADRLLAANRLDPQFVHFIEGLAMHLARGDGGLAAAVPVAARLYRYLLTLYHPERHAPQHAQTLRNLVAASLAADDAEGAARCLEERLGGDPDDIGLRSQLVQELGQLYLRQADRSTGAAGYRRAAGLYREQGLARLPEGHPRWLECAYLLAECHLSNPERTPEELAEARELLETCERAWRGTDEPQLAAVLELLGAVRLEQPGDRSENVEAAIDLLERAAEAFVAHEAAPRDLAIVRNRLGEAYRRRLAGDPARNRDSAARCFREAAAACPPSEDRDEHLRSLHGLAMVLGGSDRLADVREALEAIERCLEHDTIADAPLEHARDLLVKGNLHLRAEALGAPGERAAAEAAVEAALEVPQTSNDRLLLAALQATHGALVASRPEPPADAGPRLRRAVESAEAAGDHAILATARYQLGRFLERQGDAEEALEQHREAIRAIEADLVADAGEELQLHVERAAGRAYEAAIGLLVELDRPLEALDLLERNKARTLGRRLAERAAEPSAEAPAELVRAYRELRDRQRELETRSRLLRFARRPAAQELADARARLPGVDAVHSVAGVEVRVNRAQLERLRPLLAETVREIQRHDPGFDPAPERSRLTERQLARRVGAGRAVVEIVVTDDAVHLFVLTVADGGRLALRVHSPAGADRAALGETLLGEWLEPYHRYREAELAGRAGARKLRRAWRAAVAGIGERLAGLLEFGAIVDRLTEAGVGEVVFVPYQLLHLLPLHLMPGAGGGPLCDEVSVSYAPSLRILELCEEREPGGGPRPSLLIQDPDGSLVYSGLEAQLVEPLLGEPRVLAGEACRWRPVVEGMAEAGIVHYSGHAYFEVASPLASALVLADRRLTLGEVLASVRLPAGSLVALSACETGQVGATLPADEYAGLPAGFLDAGAAAVVGSLWVVQDSSGPLLMEAFYRGYAAEGRAPGEALRRAIDSLRRLTAEGILERFDPPGDGADPALERLLVYCRTRKDKSEPLFDHPEHWAAYTLVGAAALAGGEAG